MIKRLGKVIGHAIGSSCALYACIELLRWVFYYASHYGEMVYSPYPLRTYWWEIVVLVLGAVWVIVMFMSMLHIMVTIETLTSRRRR
jgi:hypothetical protein